MFENCNDLSSLNEERIRAIRNGTPSVLVNKEYTRRREELLSNQSITFKRVPFYPAVEKDLPKQAAINAYWEDSDPYTLIIEETV